MRDLEFMLDQLPPEAAINDDSVYKVPIKTRITVAVLGSHQCGKSSVCQVLSGSDFPLSYQATFGIKVHSSRNRRNGAQSVFLDTGGPQEYQDKLVTPMLNGEQIYMFVCDLTKRSTLDHLKSLLPSLRARFKSTPRGVLVGNRSDLANTERREILHEDGESFAGSIDLDYIEVSAKTGEGVKGLMQILETLAHNVSVTGTQNVTSGQATTRFPQAPPRAKKPADENVPKPNNRAAVSFRKPPGPEQEDDEF